MPIDLDSEQALTHDIRSWLAFAVQKLQEVKVLATALDHGREAVSEALQENRAAIESRRQSESVHSAAVNSRLLEINPARYAHVDPYGIADANAFARLIFNNAVRHDVHHRRKKLGQFIKRLIHLQPTCGFEPFA